MNLLTKRIPTIVGLLLIVVGIWGGVYYFQRKNTPVANNLIPREVRITNISDNKFSVSWTTESAEKGYVEYALVGEKIVNKVRDERDTTKESKYSTHHVTIEKLQPNTQYAFRIVSGEKLNRFDNNGSPYTTTTGPVIGATPTSENFYGSALTTSKQMAKGAIAYLVLPGGAPVSTLVNESGNYAFTLSTVRTSDLRDYLKYDASATIASVTIETGREKSIVSVSLSNSAPVPTITVGQNADFLSVGETPEVAEVTPAAPVEIFSVEPLVSQPDINAVTTGAVTLLNPKEEGEVIKTLRPEFRGTGTAGTTLSIALTGQKSISDTVVVASDKTWTWAPVIDLKTGAQKISISYIGTAGVTQKLERGFTISTSTSGIDPAFVSSPSASVKPASSSATPREVMPDTTEGTPVTGVIENTLLTGALGIVIMVVGAALLVL